MTAEEKEKFIKRLNDINKDYAAGIEYKDCYGNSYGIMQARAEAGLQELIIVIQEIINTL